MKLRKSCRVLVIDDNPDDIECCSRLLADISTFSYLLSRSQSAAEGLSAIEHEAPDCVLLDYSMPGADGMEVLERIRRTRPDLPVVMWSNHDEHSLMQRAIETGAKDFIVKSTVDASRLHAAISDSIRSAGAPAGDSPQRKAETVVLIIDDNFEDQERCVRNLGKIEDAKYQCIGASDGAEGLQKAKISRPDCILLDYSLPGSDGLEILRQLRSDEPFVPIIFMTGEVNEAIAARAIKGGATDYLTKGALSAETLHECIQAAIDDSGT